MSKSINYISNPLSIVSFNSNSDESVSVNVVQSNGADESDSSSLKEIYLWHLRLRHPNIQNE